MKRGLKIQLLICIFVLIIFILFIKSVNAAWAYQDADNTVHINSSLYNSTINNETGVAEFYDSDDIFLIQLDFSITNSSDVTIRRNNTVPSIDLNVSGDTAIVTLTQNTSEVNFTTTYTFYNDSGKVGYEESLTYNFDQSINEEKFILEDNRTNHTDDDGSSDNSYLYLGLATHMMRKEFNLSVAPSRAIVIFYTKWFDSADSSFDSTINMSINGNEYDISSEVAELTEGTFTWMEKEVSASDFIVGMNNITFKMPSRVGSEYFYLGGDNSVDLNHSASYNGVIWNYSTLRPSSGAFIDGEYLVRLLLDKTYSSQNVYFWNASNNSFVFSLPHITKYSPRMMKMNFSGSDLKLSIYGSDYGSENIEKLNLDPTVNDTIEAYIYNSTDNGYDTVFYPNNESAIDPTGLTQYQYNDIARNEGDNVQAKLILNFEEDHPSIIVTKSKWPRNYKAAFTITDDADGSNENIKRATYYGTNDTTSSDYGNKGFVGHNLKTTVTVYWSGANPLEGDTDYQSVMNDLYTRGFEVAPHTITHNADDRDTTDNGIGNFSELYTFYDWIEHGPSQCNFSAGSGSNVECTLCLGAIDSNTTYYLVDILENSSVKYVSPASTFMLNCDAGLFNTPRCLPHYSSYIDYAGNSKRIFINGRSVCHGHSDYVSIVDGIINDQDLFVGYTHVAVNNWTNTTTNVIFDHSEDGLSYIGSKQESGELWVEPLYKILDWMIDLENVTIENQTQSGDDINISMKNSLDETIDGVTLIFNDNISEAKIDNLYHLYIEDEWIVLPSFSANEVKNIQVTIGTYNSSIPRLSFVDADVKVLNATYNDSSNGIVMTVQNSSIGGIQTNRNLTLIYNATQNFQAKDNDVVFATILSGDISSSNSSYSVSYNISTGIFNFTIPTMSEHIITFEDTTSPVISFSCSPVSVTIGQIITCSCSATDNLDPNPTISYTENPSTSSAGTHTTTCSATDNMGNVAYSYVSYKVTESSGSPVYKVTQEQLQESHPITVREKQKIQFTIDEQVHVAVINSIDVENKKVEMELEEIGEIIELDENETKKIDLNNDNYYDLQISVSDIQGSSAKVEFKKIYEKVPVEEQGVMENKEIIKSKLIYYILGGIVVLILIIDTIFRKIRKKRGY